MVYFFLFYSFFTIPYDVREYDTVYIMLFVTSTCYTFVFNYLALHGCTMCESVPPNHRGGADMLHYIYSFFKNTNTSAALKCVQ